MSEKLKPCPFCGGEAFTHILGNEIAKGYYITCDECGAKTKVFGYESEAIEAWNRRAEPERIIKIGQRSGKTLESAIDYLHSVGWLQEHDRILTESAEQERKKGKWEVQPSTGDDRPFIWWKCSECGHVIFSETERDRREFHTFCGRCGADMRGE